MRRTGSFVTAFSAACAVAVLAGCGSPAAGPATSSPPAATGAATSTATATATAASPAPSDAPSPAVTVPAGWKTFTTSDGTLAFDYPGSWTVEDRAGEPTGDPAGEPTGDPAGEATGDPAGEPAGGGVFVELVSDYGKTMATLRTNMVTGSECTEKFPFMVYDSEPVPALTQGGVAPRFVYEGRTDPASSDPAESLTLAYGITSAPEPTGATACPIFHFFTWPPSGAMFGGVYDPFSTTPGGPPLVDTPEVYKDTTEYKYVKQAITSLRPVGKQ